MNILEVLAQIDDVLEKCPTMDGKTRGRVRAKIASASEHYEAEKKEEAKMREEHARLAKAHQELAAEHDKAKKKLAHYEDDEARAQALDDALRAELKKQSEARKRHTLRYE